MHHPGADRRRGLGDRLGPLGLDGVERLAAALSQDADQVDRDLSVAHGRLYGGGIAQIGLHGMDLADPAERLQMAGQFRPAHRHAKPVVALGKRPDHGPAQKARSAENRDQCVLI